MPNLIPDMLWYTVYILDVSTVDLAFFNNEFFILPSKTVNYFYGISILNPLYILLFLAGTLLYAISGKKESRLLDFSFSILFISGIISVINLLFEFSIRIFLASGNIFEDYNFLLLIIYILKLAVILFISYVYLRKRYKDKKLILLDENFIKIYKKNNGVESIPKYQEASKLQRFGHYFIDFFMIVFLFSKFIFTMSDVIKDLVYFIGDRLTMFLLYFIVSTFYYLLFETLFKATPGKYLMYTGIIHAKDNRISFGQIVIRTLSRRIPFEAFSFLGTTTNGWHDKLSNTVVVEHEADKKYGKIAKIILSILALTFLVFVILNLIDKF
ncbi:RDD family protein [uncultured Kordia sp.]|uniref:RDD family protein n=1 Tax=uncultured Kordia sp. TaxID=507699 RepID=UPI002608BED6|nr:RDD family protein [uncultured Kordia sp.]